MKRTLLAIGIGILVSFMAVPRGIAPVFRGIAIVNTGRLMRDPIFVQNIWPVLWSEFILQTIFIAVLFAVAVNLGSIGGVIVAVYGNIRRKAGKDVLSFLIFGICFSAY